MSGKVLTLPNALTGLRLLVLPLLAILIQLKMGWAACGILILAGVTDVLDGWIARRYKQESNVGKLMDPVADKVFLCVAVIFLMGRLEYPDAINPDPVIDPWLATLLLSREFLVGGLRALASTVGVVIAANWIGKIKTLFQFVGLGFIMVGGRPFWDLPTFDIGNFLLWISVILSYWSVSVYAIRVYVEFRNRKEL
jgi:CDP-diacylglycerol--glycerol-3-phosphate 3-phosphatidyltransferase